MIKLGAVVVAVLLLAGCGSDPGLPAVTVTETVEMPAVTVTETVEMPAVTASSSEPEAAPPTLDVEPATEPKNPVPILKRIPGCVLEAGTEVGDTDFNGNRYATCNLMDNSGSLGTDITVRTYPGDPRVWDTMPGNLTSDDSHKVIIGEDFIATITGDWASYSAHVDPQLIAEQVGGTLAPSS